MDDYRQASRRGSRAETMRRKRIRALKYAGLVELRTTRKAA